MSFCIKTMNEFYLYRHAWISVPHYDKRLTDIQCDALLKQGGWLVRNTYDFDTWGRCLRSIV